MSDADYLYLSLSAAKTLLGVTGSDEDAALLLTIEGASRQIDAYCGRRFWTPDASEVRVYDVPAGDLSLDADLFLCDSIVNGDGSTLAPAAYWLLPPNQRPAYAIRLKTTSGEIWLPDLDGNVEQAIEVWGWWGYSAAPPAAIRSACLRLVGYHYNRRTRSGVQSLSIGDYSVSYGGTGTDGGGDMPQGLSADLDPFRRRVLA